MALRSNAKRQYLHQGGRRVGDDVHAVRVHATPAPTTGTSYGNAWTVITNAHLLLTLYLSTPSCPCRSGFWRSIS